MEQVYRFLIGFLMGVLLIASVLLFIVISKKVLGTEYVPKPSSIIRLHQKSTGRFFCSGVVISDTLILTAAHCLMGAKSADISIRLENGKEIDVTPLYYKGNSTADYGMLKGDFRIFGKISVETRPEAINYKMLKHNIISCGYPYAGPLVCTKLSNIQRFGFYFQGIGFIYPGMSGGPVIDTDTNEVLALNSAAADIYGYYAPLINIFKEFDEAE